MREPPPLRSLDALESLARRRLASLDAGLHVPGRLIAAGLGNEILPRRPPRLCGEASRPGESPGRGVIAYDPALPPEEQSLVCAHGVAHRELAREHDPHNHSDVWILGCLLLVPRAAVQTLTAAELVARSHCPAWVAFAVREFLLRWDPSGIRILQVI